MRILICDDQPLIRESLAIVIDNQPDMDVVAQAANGWEATELSNEYQPHIILMDIRMPVMDGIEATKIIQERLPQTQIVVLTTFEEDDLIEQCIAAGAVGYLLKDISSADLIRAIRLIREGESILPATFTRKLVAKIRKPTVKPKLSAGLTMRELDVLRYLKEGYNNKELAQKLCVTEATIKNHLTNIFAKLEVRDRIQAVIFALEHDLI